MTTFWTTGSRAVQFATILFASAALWPQTTFAADTTFEEVLNAQTRASLRAVSDYIKGHPQAPDLEDAYHWIFGTAMEFGIQAEVIPQAQEYLKRPAESQALRPLAARILVLGYAKSGKLADAMAAFEGQLKGVDIQQPNDAIDLGTQLAEYAQIQGDLKAARSIYDSLSSALYLNQNARSFCEYRSSHLKLAGQPAPKIGTTDTEGKPVEHDKLKGKVVLIDFWATNCVPCIEQFPEMRDLYEEYHDKGLEIIGISLDTDKMALQAFQNDYKLPWRISLSSTDKDETRKRFLADKIPTMYIVDQKGTIAYVDLRSDRIRPAIEKLLGVGK